ncbi:MAG: dienelactone hydrolase family protein [Alphaproteobacteria bacterium]
MSTSSIRLDGPERLPQGAVSRVVVLLHGYGADGEDLIALADELTDALPGTAFLSPHGPEPCEAAGFGRQWFGLAERTPAEFDRGTDGVAPVIDRWLDRVLARFGLLPSALALVGFSQGAMLAMHVAVRRPSLLAGVVGFSGLLPAPGRLAAEIRTRPPMLLIHGAADEVIPVAALDLAERSLKDVGVAVQAVRRPGLGHGIDGAGLDQARRFLRHAFALSDA